MMLALEIRTLVLCAKVHKYPDMRNLLQVIKNGTRIAVSNGSYAQDPRAAVGAIEGEKGTGCLVRIKLVFWSGMGPQWIPKKSCKHLWHMPHTAIPSPSCTQEFTIATVACNGKSAVDRLNSHKAIEPSKAHHDLLTATINTMEKY